MSYQINGHDVKELIEGLFTVVDKESRRDVPFIFNNVQNKFYEEMSMRDIVLKARQQGFSTLILAMWLIACIAGENVSAVVISHEQEATKRLFKRVKYFIDHLEVKPCLQIESATELYFPKTNSNYYVGTAGSRAFGHGDTITHLHPSELSRWSNPELLTGMLEAVPQSGRVIVETTANGYGDSFHQFWERAHNPQSIWKPHFFGWQDCETNIRNPEPGIKLAVEEKDIRNRFKLSSEQISWRRWKINSMERPDLFPQQHPMTDIEAFIKSGTNIFEPIILQRWYESNKKYQEGMVEKVNNDIRFVECMGNLKIYDNNKQSEYAIGVDSMEGIEIEGLSESQKETVSRRHDWNVAIVKDRETWEQVAIYRSQEEPDLFARKIDLIGRYFKNALMCVEDNIGATVIYILTRELDYPNLYRREEFDETTNRRTKKIGFRTTSKTKRILIDLEEKAIRQNDTKIWDRIALRELLSYMRTPEGKMEAPSGMNDDCVIADSLATMVCELYPYRKIDDEEDYVPKKTRYNSGGRAHVNRG